MVKEEVSQLIEKMKGFTKLEEGWNGNGSKPISCEVFMNARNLLIHLINAPEVFPTACDSIQFEYDFGDNYFEVECTKNGYEVFIQKGESEREFIYTLDELYKVLNDTKIFFSGVPKRAVLFTGAFNPPTIAHEHMIPSAVNHGNFDYIIFALSNQKFLDRKQAKAKDVAYSEKDRLNMIVEMTWKYENVLVFGIEQGYTYQVLNAVKEFWNIPDLYFALGSDKLKEIERWGYNDKLLVEFCFYILQRNDSDSYVSRECNRIFSRTKYIVGKDNEMYKDISATLVRNKIKEQSDFSDLVSKDVYEYIKNNIL